MPLPDPQDQPLTQRQLLQLLEALVPELVEAYLARHGLRIRLGTMESTSAVRLDESDVAQQCIGGVGMLGGDNRVVCLVVPPSMVVVLRTI